MKKIFLIGLLAVSMSFFARSADFVQDANKNLIAAVVYGPIEASSALWNCRVLTKDERKSACELCCAACVCCGCVCPLTYGAKVLGFEEPPLDPRLVSGITMGYAYVALTRRKKIPSEETINKRWLMRRDPAIYGYYHGW